MPLDAAICNAQIDDSQSAMASLNASCQAVIEAEIQQVGSPWYDQLDQELGAAEELVIRWRRSGMLYFQTDVLAAIGSYGMAFADARPGIEQLFTELEQGFSQPLRDQVVGKLQALEQPLDTLIAQTDDYRAKLQQFEAAMIGAQQQMQSTIAKVQAQEADIQDEIAAINIKINALNQQKRNRSQGNRGSAVGGKAGHH